MAHEVKSPENQPQFPHMMIWQYWLDKTKFSDRPERLMKEAEEKAKEKVEAKAKEKAASKANGEEQKVLRLVRY